MQGTVGERFLKKFTELLKTTRKWVFTHNDPGKMIDLDEDTQGIDDPKQITPELQQESFTQNQERRKKQQ